MDEKDHNRLIRDKEKLLSAGFYAIVSLAVIFCNKAVMTRYDFGHFEFMIIFLIYSLEKMFS